MDHGPVDPADGQAPPPARGAVVRRAVTRTVLLTLVLLTGAACTSTAPVPPDVTTADLTGSWCTTGGDRLELGADGSARLGPVSDDYLFHLLRELRVTWTFDGSPDEGWTNRFDRCAS
ncbi:hypothetical protein [Micromonospora sp. DPT]|uniref:hypothetical protein n=1 Tax=Micromonospora sp. DPT TaxID=3142975 RepID=UPI00320A3859